MPSAMIIAGRRLFPSTSFASKRLVNLVEYFSMAEFNGVNFFTFETV